jgi:hypothetical protein
MEWGGVAMRNDSRGGRYVSLDKSLDGRNSAAPASNGRSLFEQGVCARAFSTGHDTETHI